MVYFFFAILLLGGIVLVLHVALTLNALEKRLGRFIEKIKLHYGRD